MFGIKKKDDKDKKKDAVKKTENSYQLQVQQSTSSTQISSSSSYTHNSSTSNIAILRTHEPNFARDSPLRYSTTKDWKPLSSDSKLNKEEFHRRLSEWERKSGDPSRKNLKQDTGALLSSTDAVRMNKYSPQPYKSAFGNSTTSNYTNNRPLLTSTYKANIPSPTFSVPPVSLRANTSSNTVNNSTPRSAFNIEELKSKVTIKVVKTRIFHDDPNSRIPTYKTSSKNRGKSLIINNIAFQGETPERLGAKFDEANVAELFKQMGFAVEKHRNKTEKEMKSIIDSYRKNKGLEKFDINVVVIMSHGFGSKNNSTEIATVDEKMISAEWIIEQFDGNNCRALKGKPKIFIFQCCRGDQRDVATDAVVYRSSRNQADMLMAYSTIPGYVSHRDPNLGTWYIQAICKVFMDNAHDTDVENLLKIVDDQLANLPYYESRQTSSYENRGFKRCFFHPV